MALPYALYSALGFDPAALFCCHACHPLCVTLFPRVWEQWMPSKRLVNRGFFVILIILPLFLPTSVFPLSLVPSSVLFSGWE